MPANWSPTASEHPNAEARSILAKTALGPVQFPHSGDFRRQLDFIAAEYANRPAICGEGESLDYGELISAVHCIAEAFITIGGASGGVGIGILGKTSPNSIVVQLAALYSGNYHYFLDASRRDTGLADNIATSGVSLLVNCMDEPENDDRFGDRGPPLVSYASLIETCHPPSPPVQYRARQAGSLFYTSGTSGRPKAVLFPLKSLMQDIQRQTHTMQVSAGDRIDMLFSLGFSASLACIYTALLNGASLWLNDLKQSGIRGLFNWLQSNKITISTLGPRTLRTMLDTVDKSDVLSGLRFLCSGGDTLLRKDIVSLRRHASPFCVIQNAYATTETRTITELLIHGRSPLPDENVMVGWPVAGKELHLLDIEGKIGEIEVTSRFIAPGYFRSESREAFSPAGTGGSLGYRTGDLGFRDEQGGVHLVGRKDDLIKIRGHRLHPCEIEAALAQHPAVTTAAIVGHPPDQLTALYLPAGDEPDIGVFRDHLLQLLPDYMIPNRFLSVESLPYNENGKLDRPALIASLELVQSTPGNSADTLSPAEKIVAEIWRDLLGVREVEASDGFVQLGGDSITAVQLQLRLEAAFGIAVPLQELLRLSTLKSLTAQLSDESTNRRLNRFPGNQAGIPFFFIPAGSGISILPDILAARIGGAHPYCDQLRYPGFAFDEAIASTVEDLAAALVVQVNRFTPTGPIILCGHSFGGVVAFEMAQQLRAAGRSIHRLVLWDSYAPPSTMVRLSPVATLSAIRSYMRRLPRHARCSIMTNRIINKVRNLARSWQSRQTVADNSGRDGESDYGKSVGRAIARAALESFRKYQPKPYDGHALLCQASSERDDEYSFLYVTDPQNDWGNLFAGRLQIESIPGDHISILKEPNATTLAAKTLSYLSETPATNDGTPENSYDPEKARHSTETKSI
ncbi:MAG: acyl-coenzyme A synthetase/AMP-(fatty) acid ligase/thioesterase domain-containing protein [Verrucomicrobiales bacterium]|jgi:acyl-coenzyme A synthetase/AMP-(fatty) acid ligase/thioesterase domain-containing protein/acyl carrier protein